MMVADPAAADIRMVVADYLEVKARMDKDKIVADELAEYILGRVEVGQSVEVTTGYGIKVSAAPRKISKDAAVLELSPEQLESIMVPTPSTELARAFLPGVLQERIMRPVGRPVIRRFGGRGAS